MDKIILLFETTDDKHYTCVFRRNKETELSYLDRRFCKPSR